MIIEDEHKNGTLLRFLKRDRFPWSFATFPSNISNCNIFIVCFVFRYRVNLKILRFRECLVSQLSDKYWKSKNHFLCASTVKSIKAAFKGCLRGLIKKFRDLHYFLKWDYYFYYSVSSARNACFCTKVLWCRQRK